MTQEGMVLTAAAEGAPDLEDKNEELRSGLIKSALIPGV